MAIRFSFYYAAIFLAVGIHLPFWPAWLKFRGLDETEISLLLSISVWIRAFANPLIAHFADRSGNHRQVIMISAAGGVITFAFFGFAEGFWALFAVNVIASTFFMSLIPLGENLASRASLEHKFDYGRVRLWGSLTFILSAYLGGWVLQRTDANAVLWMIVAAMMISFFAGFGLPIRPKRERVLARFPAFSLLRQKQFIVFIAAMSLLQSSHALVYVFGTIHWQAANIPDHIIGALWAEGVVAEIILFAFSGAVIRHVSPIKLMWLAAGGGVIRWIILANTTDVYLLFATQWLHGLTFGAAHLAAIHYILRTVPEHLSASAQGLYSGFASGLVMGLMMMLSGGLYETYSGSAFYAMAILSAAGATIAYWLTRLSKQNTSVF